MLDAVVDGEEEPWSGCTLGLCLVPMYLCMLRLGNLILSPHDHTYILLPSPTLAAHMTVNDESDTLDIPQFSTSKIALHVE
jgi:hypothetical protein